MASFLFFFVSSMRSVHFFVYLFNIINLNYGPPKHTRNAKNIDVQNLENVGSPLVFFTLIFFGTMRLFLKFFGFHQVFWIPQVFWVSPSFVSIFCNTMDPEKIPEGPPFTFFDIVTLQNSHLKKIQDLPKALL